MQKVREIGKIGLACVEYMETIIIEVVTNNCVV